VINSGPAASQLLRELVEATGFPITSTLMGLGAYPASGKNWLGMLGMHGLYEANMAMHDCDLMINIGARFDDRITGRIDAFSPNSKKAHIDIDPSSINKVIQTDFPIVGDVGHVLEDVLQGLEIARPQDQQGGGAEMVGADRGVAQGRLPDLQALGKTIKPQHAL
jgi:acetolactate synthase-1/2/3 large subunit